MRTKPRPITSHLHQITRPIARLSREEMETAVELGAADVSGSPLSNTQSLPPVESDRISDGFWLFPDRHLALQMPLKPREAFESHAMEQDHGNETHARTMGSR